MSGSGHTLTKKLSVWKKVCKYKLYILGLFIIIAIGSILGGLVKTFNAKDKCVSECIDSRFSCEKNYCNSSRDICLSKCSPYDNKCNSTCQAATISCEVTCSFLKFMIVHPSVSNINLY
ncbi:hypothetical protein CONCODRAFT_12818 [Conidiobolus coronatus NRRL 28638]|uniref:Uncharacterized protein n=1 Tax=Conidiobolus coronatus (strain ATCC 28846 / CBS 209.66 / NRRL 28638) TaxID=796925 RepID=A0A137NS29_CONC2|nr:hypothetical protein CONCODRAFT_12818 [Conidiobolus coronatus NRRL 28638]|eukprot:KXN65561.1 hypothetical protein CONCODRAFT_12818 [Conidiobolus coronatus NRRL 28638]